MKTVFRKLKKTGELHAIFIDEPDLPFPNVYACMTPRLGKNCVIGSNWKEITDPVDGTSPEVQALIETMIEYGYGFWFA